MGIHQRRRLVGKESVGVGNYIQETKSPPVKAEYVLVNGQYVSKGYAKSRPELFRAAPGSTELPAGEPKPIKRRTLERVVSGEATGGPRLEISFVVYARRPCDWDNYFVKPLQDLLIKSGILFTDGWNHLGGRIYSRKVSTEAEERTEIQITTHDTTPQPS